jgi:hypothetical protein
MSGENLENVRNEKIQGVGAWVRTDFYRLLIVSGCRNIDHSRAEPRSLFRELEA